MKTDIIMRGGQLDIPGWHNHAKEVLLTEGISTCISVQSNNLLQKIIVYENEPTAQPIPRGYGKNHQGQLPQGQP